MRTLILVAAMFAACVAPAPSAHAQSPPAAARQDTPLTPPPAAVLAMVRSTLLAVDQANKTGNYTVLRDLSSPQFREINNAARLGQAFGTLPAQGVDLLAVAVTEPLYSQPPSITPERMLRVIGVYQIAPRAIAFEILFEPVAGQWRVFSLAILPA